MATPILKRMAIPRKVEAAVHASSVDTLMDTSPKEIAVSRLGGCSIVWSTIATPVEARLLLCPESADFGIRKAEISRKDAKAQRVKAKTDFKQEATEAAEISVFFT